MHLMQTGNYVVVSLCNGHVDNLFIKKIVIVSIILFTCYTNNCNQLRGFTLLHMLLSSNIY